MKHLGFLLKFLCFLFSLTYISCVDTILPPEKKYPGNITIPGYGKLVYTRTVFDGLDITNTLIDGDMIWSFESFIVKIDRNNATYSYNKMPDEFDITNYYSNKGLHSYFFYDNKMYFRIRDENEDNDKGSIPYVTFDFDNYNTITEEEYSAIESIVYNYYMDLTGRLYNAGYDFYDSIPETYLRVSIDNGSTWFTGNMGSNFPIIVTSTDDTVYVSCEKYHENIFLFINTLRIGGGLHVFKWKYK